MTRSARAFLRCSLLFPLVLLLFTAVGCNSSSRAKASSTDPANHIDVMCIGDKIENPPAPFLYSFKYSDSTNSVAKEADITPQNMDITIHDKSGTHSFHGTRSDEASWNSAVIDLSNLSITAMAARLDALNGSSSIANHGQETTNGYNATKIAIDTASANSSDKQKYLVLFGPGSFEKGTVWMGEDGCVVKLLLDEGVSQNRGVETRHYELAMSKK